MKNKILLIISILMSMIFLSCKGDNEEKDFPLDGPILTPITLDVESTDGNVVVSANEGETVVSCGSEGGMVILKSPTGENANITIHPEFEYDVNSYNYIENTQLIIGLKHEFFEVKAKKDMLYIEFPPYAANEQKIYELEIKDVYLCFLGFSRLSIYRQP